MRHYESARISGKVVARFVHHDSEHFLVGRLSTVETPDNIGVVATQNIYRWYR